MSQADLSGRVALVTGASRGIGATIACSLARAGARVGVNYHSSRDLAASVLDDISGGGGESLLVEGDVLPRILSRRRCQTGGGPVGSH